MTFCSFVIFFCFFYHQIRFTGSHSNDYLFHSNLSPEVLILHAYISSWMDWVMHCPQQSKVVPKLGLHYMVKDAAISGNVRKQLSSWVAYSYIPWAIICKYTCYFSLLSGSNSIFKNHKLNLGPQIIPIRAVFITSARICRNRIEASVVRWTAGQQVERSILHQGHDS